MQLIAIVMRMLERFHTDICPKNHPNMSFYDIPFEKDHTFFSFQRKLNGCEYAVDSYRHGLRTPNKPFFIEIPKFWA
jgi:hypothetical protein